MEISFKRGDHVRITTGVFEDFEGSVDQIDEQLGHVVVLVDVSGRTTPVECKHQQLEAV
jgi:transcriptional antiterminator NusG